MTDSSAFRSHFESNNLPNFTSYTNSQKRIKAAIRQLPDSTHEEDISDGLVNIGSDVISAKKISTIRRSPAKGKTTVNLSLFLIPLPRRRSPMRYSN
jgi:hypothetical protein